MSKYTSKLKKNEIDEANCVLCKRLSEITGWTNTRRRWYHPMKEAHPILVQSLSLCYLTPAFTIGDLFSHIPYQLNVKHLREDSNFYLRVLPPDDLFDYWQLHYTDNRKKIMEVHGTTLADAACMLVILLARKGLA